MNTVLHPHALTDWLAPGHPAISQALRRATSAGFQQWWQARRLGSASTPSTPVPAQTGVLRWR